jgi:hypothetical protein
MRNCFSLCYFLLDVYHFILEQIFVMMILRAIIFTVVFVLSFSAIFADDPCRFEYSGKGVIDFSFIGRTDEKAAYTDEVSRAVSNFSMFI